MGDAVPVTGPTEHLPRDDGRTVELPQKTRRAPQVATSPADTQPTEPHPTPQPHPPVDPAPRRSGFWRELSGALAVGLGVLALVVLGLQVVAWFQGVPGPGLGVVIGHVLTAVAALVAQRFADRRTGPETALAVVLVGIATGIAIWFFWWA